MQSLVAVLLGPPNGLPGDRVLLNLCKIQASPEKTRPADNPEIRCTEQRRRCLQSLAKEVRVFAAIHHDVFNDDVEMMLWEFTFEGGEEVGEHLEKFSGRP